jgi:tetratricopeptide (TPR) repeat protein
MKTSNYFIGPFIVALSFLLFTDIRGQTSVKTGSLIDEATSFFDESQEKKALNLYLKVLETDPQNFEALWHTSLLYARIGYRYESKKEMIENYNLSLKYAEQTLKLYPNEGYSHFVYAVANGRVSDISDSQTRINKSHVVKKHAEKAVELMPDYAPAWHLLGLWHSKIANIGSARQFAAGLFSKGIPKGASNEKAVQYMNKAISMNPEQTLRYKLDLAHHFERAGENQQAIETLKEIIQLTPQNYIDKWNLERAKELFSKLQ